MAKRKEVRVENQEPPFYEGKVQAKTVVFILAIMFGSGGRLNSGSNPFKAAGDYTDLKNIRGMKNFWLECPDEWIVAWRQLLFGGCNE